MIDIYFGTSISTVFVPWPQYTVNSNPLRRLRMPAVVPDEERRQERPSLYQHGHGLHLGNGPLQAVFQKAGIRRIRGTRHDPFLHQRQLPVICHPIEDGLRRHLRQDRPPRRSVPHTVDSWHSYDCRTSPPVCRGWPPLLTAPSGSTQVSPTCLGVRHRRRQEVVPLGPPEPTIRWGCGQARRVSYSRPIFAGFRDFDFETATWDSPVRS